MIEPGVLARTVSDYTHRRPHESPTLAPLWQTLAQHAKAGACHHRGTCPLVTVGPVVVNEHHEVLMVRGGRAPARLPEARLTEGSTRSLKRPSTSRGPWASSSCGSSPDARTRSSYTPPVRTRRTVTA
ncbi:hypothetical protein AB0K62_04320 [Streptomyces halstedii]|uniref:hypothetical protein n=1 Tax=Streptomyces halstedii TaxID=1944 RepID=UPI00346147F4